MTTTTLQQANDVLRSAVKRRLDATPADDPKVIGYKLDQGDPEPGETYAEWSPAFQGSTPVHPTSQAFFDLCDSLKEMHRRKSRDYGCPSGEDPLANIRNGAKFVGIPAWKGAMVRLSDKVTRLAAYNATGRLENESLEDNLFDLASYSLLALLLHREEQGK
jgi:hypothetical protein